MTEIIQFVFAGAIYLAMGIGILWVLAMLVSLVVKAARGLTQDTEKHHD